MRRMTLLFVILMILVLAVLAAASAAPVVTADAQTYCRCVWVDYWWCYRCCDYTGCIDLYCGPACP